MLTPGELAMRWRKDAETFDRYADAQMASVCRRHADELDGALRTVTDESLNLATAALESGYSRDRLRHMVADGLLPNAGRRGAPRIKRGDLPKKSRGASDFDAAATAREMLTLSSKSA